MNKADISELVSNVKDWSKERNLHEGDSSRQMLKTVEEVGEVARALAKGRTGDDLKDGIGDVTVTLVILAQQNGLEFEDCLQHAWDQIKSRKGRTVNGVFIKE